MIDFPRMVYKDIDKNGDVSEPSNQRTVTGLQQLKAAINDGWRTHPDETVAAGEADAIFERGAFAKAEEPKVEKKKPTGFFRGKS